MKFIFCRNPVSTPDPFPLFFSDAIPTLNVLNNSGDDKCVSPIFEYYNCEIVIHTLHSTPSYTRQGTEASQGLHREGLLLRQGLLWQGLLWQGLFRQGLLWKGLLGQGLLRQELLRQGLL